MPKFEVNMILSSFYYRGSAQDLADAIQRGLRRVAEIDVESIEVKEVGVRIKRGETYFRR